MLYRKKPIKIEALQWNGSNREELQNFCDKNLLFKEENFFIKTLEGELKLTVGDYIIKGIAGEYYPCKESIFHSTYELVSS